VKAIRYTVNVSGETKNTIPVAVRRYDAVRGTDLTAIDIAVRHVFGRRAFWTPAELKITRSKRATTIEAMVWIRRVLNRKQIEDAIGVHTITAKLEP
jgi:hypothetical protein